MGNNPSYNSYNGGTSSEPSKESLLERLDYIASHYILTMDFESLKKLHTKEYCNKLVIITRDIFDKYFSELDIEQVSKDRLKEDDILLYFNKKDLTFIEESNKDKKLLLCQKLAVFYVKIAHLFSVISSTINPDYVYTSRSGNLEKRKFSEKEKMLKTNLCGKRINALKNQGSFCYFNLNENGDALSLDDEPGIPELIQLYYDDNFDFKTGKFLEMSKISKEQFLKDLHEFYKEFTGESVVPSHVTKFSDIKLKNYSNFLPSCKKNKTEDLDIAKRTHESLIEYAKNLKQMISSAKIKQEQLLQIINKIFISVVDENNRQFIRIHPRLTERDLQRLIEEARTIIVELYLKCESDFTKGIQLYEAIVESQILKTTQMQIHNLQKLTEMLIQGNKQ